eukprot:940255-Prymnesium_polylepis.1
MARRHDSVLRAIELWAWHLVVGRGWLQRHTVEWVAAVPNDPTAPRMQPLLAVRARGWSPCPPAQRLRRLLDSLPVRLHIVGVDVEVPNPNAPLWPPLQPNGWPAARVVGRSARGCAGVCGKARWRSSSGVAASSRRLEAQRGGAARARPTAARMRGSRAGPADSSPAGGPSPADRDESGSPFELSSSVMLEESDNWASSHTWADGGATSAVPPKAASAPCAMQSLNAP